MKTCKKCGEAKPVDEFHRHATNKDGRRGSCKPCDILLTAEWHAAHPDYYRRKHLRRTYGITLEQYHDLLTSQSGGCACCGATRAGGSSDSFHVDHCHETGKIRGLLCNNCNIGIGALGDNASGVARALAYLERS